MPNNMRTSGCLGGNATATRQTFLESTSSGMIAAAKVSSDLTENGSLSNIARKLHPSIRNPAKQKETRGS
jgi:hypothetical protein